jgi:pyruvate dehydrogenase kinase 2/3/4
MLLSSQTPSDLYSFSHHRNTTRLDNERIGALRHLSQRKGGLWGTVHERISPRTEQSAVGQATEQDDVPQRIGMGLPLSNIYATYFGGSLELVSMDGWGKRSALP